MFGVDFGRWWSRVAMVGYVGGDKIVGVAGCVCLDLAARGRHG